MTSEPREGQILLYTTPDGQVEIDVYFADETVWLSQKKMAELFDIDRSVISKHLKKIFSDLELEEDSVCAIFAHTAVDGKTYSTNFYNLDAIISVGYRVNSRQATQFRKWATQTLKEYVIKGFVLDEVRLKNGHKKGTGGMSKNPPDDCGHNIGASYERDRAQSVAHAGDID